MIRHFTRQNCRWFFFISHSSDLPQQWSLGLNLNQSIRLHIGAVQTWANDRERRRSCGESLIERGAKPIRFLRNTHKALRRFTTPLLNITCLERRDITWDKARGIKLGTNLTSPSIPSHTQPQGVGHFHKGGSRPPRASWMTLKVRHWCTVAMWCIC